MTHRHSARSLTRTRYSVERIERMLHLHDVEGLPWTVVGQRMGCGGSHAQRLCAALRAKRGTQEGSG